MGTVIKIVAALAVVAVLCGGGFLIGTNSVQPELRAAERRGDGLSADLRVTKGDLQAAEEELVEVKDDLADVQSTLAACDGDRATEIFEDLLAMHGEFLRQYRRYLGNDELFFWFDFDTTDQFQDGYNGNNSMIDQFDEALTSCTQGEGANA